MTKVNDEQRANFMIVLEKIRLMEAALPELARQVHVMIEESEKQKKHLTDLQSHMEQ